MMKTQIEALCAKLNEIGIDAKIWKGLRIYLNGFGRDIKAFFEFEDSEALQWDDLLEGTSLQVYTNANQSQQWKLNRYKSVKFEIMKRLERGGVIDKICETSEEVI